MAVFDATTTLPPRKPASEKPSLFTRGGFFVVPDIHKIQNIYIAYFAHQVYFATGVWNNILILIALITAVTGVFLQLSSLTEEEEIDPKPQKQEVQVTENNEAEKEAKKEQAAPPSPEEEAKEIKPPKEKKEEPVAANNTEPTPAPPVEEPPQKPLLKPMPDGWMPPGVTRIEDE
ncbi:MAG: hypothetical protein KJO79_08090 [Verrucomicrobiae bacterium]|nr:hypothetical protein [Verrucomicrobiae bacterium]NNJ87125.1 hypothetical protein [Akkermansiaceae bacterium]